MKPLATKLRHDIMMGVHSNMELSDDVVIHKDHIIWRHIYQRFRRHIQGALRDETT